MSNGSRRGRTLTAEISGWSVDQVERLLRRRPDLLRPEPPKDLAGLAQRAQYHPSVSAAIDRTNLPQNRLLQLVVCCPQDVQLDEFAAALPDGVELSDVEPILVSLEEAALVWRHGNRLHSSGTLRQAMPTTLGPPVADLAVAQTAEYLEAAIAKIRGAVVGSPAERRMPEPPGRKGRPARKPQLIDHLADLLSTPGVVEAALRRVPADARKLAVSMATGSPAVPAEHFLFGWSSFARNSYYARQPSYQLFEHGLLLPGRDHSRAFQPREVGVALRGGRPLSDLALEPPVLATGAMAHPDVDRLAAEKGVGLLDTLAELLGLWADQPAKQLKSGGIGVSGLRQLAAALDVTLEDTGRLVELAHLAGLLDDATETRVERRKHIVDRRVRPSAIAARWLEQSAAQRWRQLAAAWLRAEHWPSAAGRKLLRGDKVLPAVAFHGVSGVPLRRRTVLDALCELGEGDGAGGVLPTTSVDALHTWVYWHGPQVWLGRAAFDPVTAMTWIYEEAEMLGILAAGRLSSFGRELVAGTAAAAERLFASCVPEEVASFTLQADMTAVVVGRLDRDVLNELRLLADVESTGAATTFRFSETSLRRALDAGRDGDSIRAFLDKYAAKGVPQALDYLVSDVARRHGHLMVGAAAAFVTSPDAAVLADAASHRRTRKLRLRLLAPTVAVSPLPPDKVLAGLRDAGFLPVDDPSGAKDNEAVPDNVVRLDRPSGSAREVVEGTVKLPEPFREDRRRAPVEPALANADARGFAEAICAGAPAPAGKGTQDPGTAPAPASRRRASPSPDLQLVLGHGFDGATPPGSDLDDVDWDAFEEEFELDEGGLTIESFRAAVSDAAKTGGVLGLVLEEAADDDPPIVLAVTALQGDDAAAGLDLLSGEPTVVSFDDLAGLVELGSMDLPPPAGGRGRGPRRGRSRR